MVAASPRERIVILGGARTAIGSFGGAFKDVGAYELGAAATVEALKRTGIGAEEVGEVVMGCISQVGPDAYNARRVALGAGLDRSVPAFNVNRLCGSGLQAIWSAAQELLWSPDLTVAVAGGNESMSRTPFLEFNARGNSRLGDRKLLDGTLAILTDPFSNKHMGFTAVNVANKYGISREQQDEFALESQRRASTDEARAAFAEEIVTVSSGGRKPVEVSVDEHPKPNTTLEILAGLRPAFDPEGSVTAGNSSGINDGAASTVLMRESDVRERGLSGLVTLEAVATAAMEPELMGYAPVVALERLWRQTGLSPADVDVFEVNEAFAAQAVAVVRDAGLDPEKVNPYGGAIALGHPVGATGAILTLRAALDLHRRDLEYAVVTMCIGGGQALAALLRRYDG
ncbi:thiolase family protein [Leucobacter denitrificans]|uniref:Probable acetyl-CoA acetyltransferase n=1 Tax=Leucobacter denitrificans TaxID=683042 RepID=A0A7G9S2W5_9MICO|nr:thiolase family protein [Leucobacter denitrificans]QNN62190.1 thiolase family protein [Leucobacter denitrificans]